MQDNKNTKEETEVKTEVQTEEFELESLRDLIIRLNKVEGQIKGIKNMLDRGDYYVDIMIQVYAAVAALNSLNREILVNHLYTSVSDDIKAGNNEKLNEIADLVKWLSK